jgi:hypothetical protein
MEQKMILIQSEFHGQLENQLSCAEANQVQFHKHFMLVSYGRRKISKLFLLVHCTNALRLQIALFLVCASVTKVNEINHSFPFLNI